MALQDNALTTVSTVEGELGLSSGTDTATLERYINTFSDLFESYTGRPWHRDDEYTEKIKSTGDTRLLVSRRPVRSITEIKVKGDTVDSGDYEIEDDDAGFIRLDDEAWESTAVATRRIKRHRKYHEFRVEVTYDGGYVTPQQVDDGTFTDRDLPADIEHAVITSVANAYQRQGQPSNIKSESIGDASVSFATPDSGGSLGGSTSPAFESAVKRHKDRSVL